MHLVFASFCIVLLLSANTLKTFYLLVKLSNAVLAVWGMFLRVPGKQGLSGIHFWQI
jgi:hypothetical protein